jgi:hypothetical protein
MEGSYRVSIVSSIFCKLIFLKISRDIYELCKIPSMHTHLNERENESKKKKDRDSILC